MAKQLSIANGLIYDLETLIYPLSLDVKGSINAGAGALVERSHGLSRIMT